MSNPNNRGNDFYQHLINNPIPSPAGSSSAPQTSNSSPPGFSSYNRYQNAFQPSYQYQQFQQTQFQQQPFQPQQNPNPQFQQTFHQQQFVNPQFQQRFSSEEEMEDEVDPEEVVEAVTRRKGKGKSKGEGKGKRVCVAWSDEDAKLLAERWIGASENPTKGNSQTDDSFWKTIREGFNRVAMVQRNKNQLTGKWQKIRLDVKAFASILKKYEQQRASGADDKRIFDSAHIHYRDIYGKSFTYESCYHVLKGYPKFWDDYGLTTPRPRQIQNPPNIHLDDDEPIAHPNPDPLPGMNALFCDDQIRRPPLGRDGSRKSQRTASSSDATSSRKSTDEAIAEISLAAKVQKETLLELQDTAKQVRLTKAFDIIKHQIPDSMPKKQRQILERTQKHMYEKYKIDLVGPGPDPDEEADEDDEDYSD